MVFYIVRSKTNVTFGPVNQQTHKTMSSVTKGMEYSVLTLPQRLVTFIIGLWIFTIAGCLSLCIRTLTTVERVLTGSHRRLIKAPSDPSVTTNLNIGAKAALLSTGRASLSTLPSSQPYPLKPRPASLSRTATSQLVRDCDQRGKLLQFLFGSK